MNRRRLLAGAPAALVLSGAAAGAAVQPTTPEPTPAPSFYSTLDPEQKVAFDKLRAIVKAQADGTWVDPPSPDAELHLLCAEFHRLHAEGGDAANPQWEQASAAAWETFKQIDDVIALTHRGCRAKAGVAVEMLAMFNEGESGGNPEATFALHMLRDWLELPA